MSSFETRFSRRASFREPRPSILLLVEGARTEPLYLNGICRVLGLRNVRIIGPAGVPRTMVHEAVAVRNKYDEVWCVFDVDSHPFLADAIQHAISNDIALAVSDPCFEFFLLLHFVEYSRPCTRKQIAHELKKRIKGYKKTFDFEALWPAYKDAHANGAKLDAWHLSRGTSGRNPSTAVFNLVDRLLECSDM